MELIVDNTSIKVNSYEISEEVILNEMQYHPGNSQRDSMIKASESLIISELLKQRAENLGIFYRVDSGPDATVATEESVEERTSRGKGFSTAKGDEGHIESACIDDESFSETLFEMDIDFPQATEQECKTYYQNNLEKFCTSPLLEVSHILLAATPDDELGRIEAEDKAKLLIRKLLKDESQFPELALKHSQCPSAKTSGQLGQLSKGQTVPEFETVLFKCNPGLLPDPISSRYGIHVVKVDRRIDGRQLELEMVSKRILDYLNERGKRKAIAQYIGQLISEADIQGFDFSQLSYESNRVETLN